MKPHIVEYEPLVEFLATYEALMAQAEMVGGGMKRMVCTLSGTIIVRKGKERVYAGSDLTEAMDAYNELY